MLSKSNVLIQAYIGNISLFPPKTLTRMNSIYDYTDYRTFLRDRFLGMKAKNPLFSYRSFNRLAGTKSSGFLKLVIDGKRNLAEDGIGMVAKGFRLLDGERKYFETLVRFNQATTHAEKNRLFHELSKNKKFIAAKPMTASQYRLFSHWFYVAILELVRIPSDARKDLEWLQKRLNPQVDLRDIKNAVNELKSLGLLGEEDPAGLVRLENMLTTDDKVRSLSVANFHVEMSRLAARVVMEEPAKDREFSALTVAISEEGFQKAKEEIQKFRKTLHSILEQENGGPKDMVGHINVQLFKLSRKE